MKKLKRLKSKLIYFLFFITMPFIAISYIFISRSVINDQVTINHTNASIDQNENSIATPTTFSLEQKYNISRFEIKQSSNEQLKLLNLNSNSYNNAMLPFAKIANSDGTLSNQTYNDTIEFDLNLWKPIGMDDEKFLKETKFNIDGYVSTNEEVSKSEQKSHKLMNFNIIEDSYADAVSNLRQNFKNLYVPKIKIIEEQKDVQPTRKLVFNLLYKKEEGGKVQYPYQSDSFCFITFDIIHEQSQDQTKPGAINRLLITPKVVYSNIDSNYRIVIPDQELKFSFYNPFFTYNENSRISIDSYISDNQRFNFYENFLEEKNNANNSQNLNHFLTVDTKKNDGLVEVILNNQAPLGKQIPKLEIRTDGFYLYDNNNSIKSKVFEIDISGIKIKNLKFIRTKSEDSKDYKDSEDSEDFSIFEYNEDFNGQNEHLNFKNLNISFEINDNEFDRNNGTVTKYFTIADWKMFSNYNSSIDASLKLEIKLSRAKNPFFHYYIDEFKFIAKRYHNNSGGYGQDIDVSCEIHPSNEVIVKVKPKDFSFTRIKYELIKTQRTRYDLVSTYSSNVFDDSLITDNNNQVVQTNYQKVYQQAKNRFEHTLKNNNDFKVFSLGNHDNALSLFNQPFIKTQYTSSNNKFRTEGRMILMYASKIETRYFKTLDIILRAKVNKQNDQNEIITVSINNEELNKLARLYNNTQSLVDHLNTLDINDKLRYIQIINKDNDQLPITIINTIKFNVSKYDAIISATISLNSNFKMYDKVKAKLVQTITLDSTRLEINDFSQKVSLSLDEQALRDAASLCENYQAFKDLHQRNIKQFLSLTPNDASVIQTANFIDQPGYNNKITIDVTLNDGYLFDNNQKQISLSIANVNWKNQNIKSQQIAIDLDYLVIAQYLNNYYYLDHFKQTYANLTVNDFANAIEFKKTYTDLSDNSNNQPYQTTINDLASIDFVGLSSSPNKIKVVIQAKEWRYFDFVGSTAKDDKMEFVISNIVWKDQENINPKLININIDIAYLYQLMLNLYNQKPDFSLKDFINLHINSFVKYNNNELSIIKFAPYELLAINAPKITTTKQGILINLELNDKYYINKTNNFETDKHNATFTELITIQQIIDFHNDYISNKPQFQVNLNFNYQKIAKDAKKHHNINNFIKYINNDYELSSYLILNDIDDLKKIKSYNITKVSNSALDISITLFDQYYFDNQEFTNKTKTFNVVNLLFKNNGGVDQGGQDKQDQTQPDQNKLIAINVNVNKQNLFAIAKNYQNVDQLVQHYASLDNSFASYQKLLLIDQDKQQAIKQVTMVKGSGNRSVKLVIKLNEGFYFNNYPTTQNTLEITVNNLLFTSDPEPEQIFSSVNLKFKGNEFNQKANQFQDFNSFKTYLLENDNWKQFFDIKVNSNNNNNNNNQTINPILKFNIQAKSNSKLLLKITLNEGFYFENENVWNNSKIIVVGNVLFNNQTTDTLKNVRVLINEKMLYHFTKDKTIDSWDQFLEITQSRILNFTDKYNAIWWTNVNSYDVFSSAFLVVRDNQLILVLELIDGYYFDSQNFSNIRLELNYSIDQLKQYYQRGMQLVNQEQQTFDLIINLCIAIPFIITFLVIAIYIIKIKIDHRKRFYN